MNDTAQKENDDLPATAAGLAATADLPMPSIGRIVHYVLSEEDADQINRRRIADCHSPSWVPGAQAHVGNNAHEGDVLPMMIVKVWSNDCVNGQVFLDGNDTFWALSAGYGSGPSRWSWPPRV